LIITYAKFIILAGDHPGDGRIVINDFCLYSVFWFCLDGFVQSLKTIIIHLGYGDGIVMVSQESILGTLVILIIKANFIETYFILIFSLDDNVCLLKPLFLHIFVA
jgi:hypothetical protein